MEARHMETDTDSKGTPIYWFDLDGQRYGVKDLDGERAIMYFVAGSIMDMEYNFVASDRMKALASSR